MKKITKFLLAAATALTMALTFTSCGELAADLIEATTADMGKIIYKDVSNSSTGVVITIGNYGKNGDTKASEKTTSTLYNNDSYSITDFIKPAEYFTITINGTSLNEDNIVEKSTEQYQLKVLDSGSGKDKFLAWGNRNIIINKASNGKYEIWQEKITN